MDISLHWKRSASAAAGPILSENFESILRGGVVENWLLHFVSQADAQLSKSFQSFSFQLSSFFSANIS